MGMTEAVRLPTPTVAEPAERPINAPAGRTLTADRGGWTLMLVPATICLAMFVVAFWW